MAKISFVYDSKVCIMEYKNKIIMQEQLEKYATNYEGSIKNRMGYNFEVNSDIRTLMEVSRHSSIHDIPFPLIGTKYIIGYIAGDMHTRMHEMLHAKYFIYEDYRKIIGKFWSSFDSDDQNKITIFLTKLGYPKKVHLDEFQAYWYSERKPRRFFGL